MPNSTQETSSFNLTQMTKVGRVVVKGVILTLVGLMVGRVLVTSAYNYWKATHPEPPPPPTVGFGVLPTLQFPAQLAAEKPLSYLLETPTGTFPKFADRAKVYLMTHPEPSLLADENAKKAANKLGFATEPEVVNSSFYRWTKTEPLLTTLDLDINTLHFSLSTDYLSRPDILYTTQLPTNFDAVRDVKSFLSSAGLLPADIATSSGTVKMLKATGSSFTPAVSLSDASVLQVDLHRTPIDETFSFFTPDDNPGTISSIVGSGGIHNSILKFAYAHHTIDYSQVHTYPIRSPDSAWQLLKAGEGYIAHKGTVDQAVIRKVELGYFDTPEQQSYMQPIYVFSGDDDFLGYVSAVDPKFIQVSR
jgi:hypothetical protein